jgi:nicotinamidase-related amidase
VTNLGLIEADDSIFIAVDVQNNFTRKLEAAQSHSLLERICWLVGVANWLRIPIIVTVEDMKLAGGPSPELQKALTPQVSIIDKMVFGLADQPDILTEIQRAGRKTTVLVGLETDVCVLQSALGLMSRGYRVAVVSDATCSPGESHAVGLARMRDAGVIITNTKGLFYEWMRTVERARRFEIECGTLKLPGGLVL